MDTFKTIKKSKLMLRRIASFKESFSFLEGPSFPSLSTMISEKPQTPTPVSTAVSTAKFSSKVNAYEVFPSEFLKKYSIIEEIGKGMQGVVYKVQENSSQGVFAAKIYQFVSEEYISNIRREVENLSKLAHENILKFKEFIADESQSSFAIITEYVESIDLKAFVSTGPLNRTILGIADQLVSAIQYLHQNSVSHGDLNPGNILINQTTLQVKIIDFGLSKLIFPSEILSPFQGDCEFRPPEDSSMQYENFFAGDKWATGLILLSLLKRKVIKTKKAVSMMRRGNDREEGSKSVLNQMRSFMSKGNGWDWDCLMKDCFSETLFRKEDKFFQGSRP